MNYQKLNLILKSKRMNLPSIMLIFMTLLMTNCSAQMEESRTIETTLEYESGYEDFLSLGIKLREIRENKLVDLNSFLEMQKDSNTVILDSRSGQLYLSKHIKGAINLPFAEYTQKNLESLIPDKRTRILIYCNNNFKGDNKHFASKTFVPDDYTNQEILRKKKPILLALNIPTFITLHGYGYENVYELKDVVDIRDKRLKFEGSIFGIDIPQLTTRN